MPLAGQMRAPGRDISSSDLLAPTPQFGRQMALPSTGGPLNREDSEHFVADYQVTLQV